MSKPTLISIDSSKDETSLHRYVGNKHYGTMTFQNSEVKDSTEVKALVEDYRVLGNAIYGTEPEVV